MTKLVSIAKIDPLIFSIIVEGYSGSVVETICRIRHSDVGDGKMVEVFNFDSKEFNAMIWSGDIYVRDIARAISSYIDGQSA